MKSFVSSLSVTVITCFEAKSRRRRADGDTDITSRKAFRLCINDNDRTRLLDDSAWPDSIVISEWFFKGSQEQGQSDKRRKVGYDTPPHESIANTNRLVTGASGCHGGNVIQTQTCSDADIQDDINVDEVTILVNNDEVNLDSDNVCNDDV